jgi:3-hydroxyacyl-CoA dehydrogenase
MLAQTGRTGYYDPRDVRERQACGGDAMKVTIIGAGNMGRGIGTRAIAGGHEVEILDRDPAEARALADQLGGSASVLDSSRAFGGE